MNLPNKISVVRICMIPVFVLFFFLDVIPFNHIIAAVIFAARGSHGRARRTYCPFEKSRDQSRKILRPSPIKYWSPPLLPYVDRIQHFWALGKLDLYRRIGLYLRYSRTGTHHQRVPSNRGQRGNRACGRKAGKI